MTATPRQLANPSAPGAATSVPTRGARPPDSRLAQLNPLCGARMERRELRKAAARRRGTDGEPSAAGTAPKGRGDSRTSQDISRLGKSPPPPFLRGEYTQKVHVMEWRGIRAQRLPAAHPAPTLTRGAGHGSRGSLAGRLSSLGRAREGGRKQGRRRLGKKWSRNGKIQTHPQQMVSRCKLRCFRAFPRARPLPPARAPPQTHSLGHTRARALTYTHTQTHTHTHTHSRARAGPREYSMKPPHNK
ncbi:uncharacterized protein LOC129635525 [Bubalus kerabau]|uniref:uncharacterized protein LOC129635525 n=1 Tax=Bubalus carabanensis TaxID=3119969 RepID=UPI00244EC55F|nr:uncharacterized protein LOC129635525 [Bubalus carabanensis]